MNDQSMGKAAETCDLFDQSRRAKGLDMAQSQACHSVCFFGVLIG